MGYIPWEEHIVEERADYTDPEPFVPLSLEVENAEAMDCDSVAPAGIE